MIYLKAFFAQSKKVFAQVNHMWSHFGSIKDDFGSFKKTFGSIKIFASLLNKDPGSIYIFTQLESILAQIEIFAQIEFLAQ